MAILHSKHTSNCLACAHAHSVYEVRHGMLGMRLYSNNLPYTLYWLAVTPAVSLRAKLLVCEAAQ